MAVNLSSVGVQTNSVSLCESVDYEQKVDEAVRQACDSGFGAAETFDPIIEFSLKGAGDIPAGYAIGGDGGLEADITGVTDGVGTETRIITNLKVTETADDFNGWEISGTYYPNT